MKLNTLEIRNYLLKPHMLEHFIDYFEEHFIASQAAVNMKVLGQFRLVGEPQHFVWLRGFDDMQARLQGLEGFYYGEFWQKHRNTTNSMILDNDDVHLLRPIGDVDLTAGLSAESVAAELAAGTISAETGVVAIDFYQARAGERDALVSAFQTQVLPIYQQEGIQFRGAFVAEMSENDFPRLPVIQNENELIVITAYASEEAYHEQRAKVSARVHEAVGAAETLLLQPTLRSAIRYLV